MKATSLLAGAALSALMASAASAETQTEAGAETLRVCASTKDAPYSDARGEGYENRLAGVIAAGTGRELELVYIDKEAIFLVRDGVDKGLCDVVMGVDSGDERLLTTEPYFRSGYVLVTPAETELSSDSWQVIGEPQFDTIAYRAYGPAEALMKYAGKFENNLIYVTSLTNFEDRRNRYTNVPADRVVSEVADGSADLAIAFGPEVARYVKGARTPLKMTVISDSLTRVNGVEVPLQFDQSIGVSKSMPELRDAIQQALVDKKVEIDAILAEEGIPLLPPSS